MPPLSVSILHCADLHLDSSFRGSLGSAAMQARAEELKATLAAIVELARQRQARLLLVAGDLFEGKYVRKATVKFAADLFAGLAGTDVFIAPGNHDPAVAGSYYRTYAWPDNVHIFGPKWQAYNLPDCPVTVWGWGYDRPAVHDRILRELRVTDRGRLNIAVLHGAAEIGIDSGHDPYLPFSADEVIASGADYIALGHYHRASTVANVGGRDLARYPGAPASLRFGQKEPYGVIVGTVGRERSELELVPIPGREHRAVAVDVSGAVSSEDVTRAVLAALPEAERRQHLFRLTLTGLVDAELQLSTALLDAQLAPDFHYVRCIDETRPDYDLEALAAEQTVRGAFVRRLQAELAAAPPAERPLLEQALAYGLAAFAGKVTVS